MLQLDFGPGLDRLLIALCRSLTPRDSQGNRFHMNSLDRLTCTRTIGQDFATSVFSLISVIEALANTTAVMIRARMEISAYCLEFVLAD